MKTGTQGSGSTMGPEIRYDPSWDKQRYPREAARSVYAEAIHRTIDIACWARYAHSYRPSQAASEANAEINSVGETKDGWRPGVEALVAYYQARANGILGKGDAPSGRAALPFDGSWFWTVPGATTSTVTYTQGPRDKRWMEEMDRNYILRLKHEGKLLSTEPDADEEISRDHAFRDEILIAIEEARGERQKFGIELSSSERARKEREMARRQLEEQRAQEASVPYKCDKMRANTDLKTPTFADLDLSACALDVARLLDVRSDFTSVNLTNTHLNPNGWQIILAALRRNRAITQIEFTAAETPTEVQGQIRALLALNVGERNLALHPLGLESRASFSYVLGLLADHATTTLNLSSLTLTLERAQILSEFITRSRGLTMLNLRGVQCVGEAGQILLDAMRQKTPLKIDCTQAQFDGESFFILCDIVRTKPIMKIDFTGCIIPPGKLGKLQTSLQQNSALEEVIGLPTATPISAPVGHGTMFTASSSDTVQSSTTITPPNTNLRQ